jgi:hypothetical protein
MKEVMMRMTERMKEVMMSRMMDRSIVECHHQSFGYHGDESKVSWGHHQSFSYHSYKSTCHLPVCTAILLVLPTRLSLAD